MRRAAVAAMAVALLAPAAAQASTVRVDSSSGTVKYGAASGERNRVVVSSAASSEPTRVTVTVEDSGAVIEPGSGCVSVDDHTASCDVDSSTQDNTEVRLGDRSDTLHTSNPFHGVAAYGGRGSDLLDGGAGADYLNGGGGAHDRLLGGARADYLTDGDRSGGRGAAGPTRDVLDGGPFLDTVSYRGRRRAVKVDLRSDVGGERGERDSVPNIERVIGGARGDRLVGDGGGNRLTGLDGHDVLYGRGGPDFLSGGKSGDRLFGGGDGDVLVSGTGRDILSCASGADTAERPGSNAVIGRSCENATFAFGGEDDPGFLRLTPNPVSLTAQSAEFRIPCPTYDEDGGAFRPCGGRITLANQFGLPLGSGTIPQRTDASEETAVAQLNARGRRLTARPKGVVATVLLSGDTLPDVGWNVRLKR